MQIGSWKSRDDTANLVPFPERHALPIEAIDYALTTIAEQGFTATYTAAMTPTQAEPFFQAGFELVEELHLLRCALSETVARPERGEKSRLRRGRRLDYPEVLTLDALAFDDFWQFDRASLADSMRATPRHRFQVTRTEPVTGYHVTGLAGSNAYVQRVAVHPEAQGQGWGRALVEDSLRWAWKNGARTAHVNTQLTNERAVALYERTGFVLADERLQVLYRTVDADPA